MLTSEGEFVQEQGVLGAGAQFTSASLALLVLSFLALPVDPQLQHHPQVLSLLALLVQKKWKY
jgi:hypothetical protein